MFVAFDSCARTLRSSKTNAVFVNMKPAKKPHRKCLKFRFMSVCSVLRFAKPNARKRTAEMGTRAVIGDNTPLKKPFIPSFL